LVNIICESISLMLLIKLGDFRITIADNNLRIIEILRTIMK